MRKRNVPKTTRKKLHNQFLEIKNIVDKYKKQTKTISNDDYSSYYYHDINHDFNNLFIKTYNGLRNYFWFTKVLYTSVESIFFVNYFFFFSFFNMLPIYSQNDCLQQGFEWVEGKCKCGSEVSN